MTLHPSERFSHVIPHLCGMAERFRQRNLFMIFKAFFDESDVSPQDGDALIFGGFIGHVEEWERASAAWDLCLHESPRIEYFSHHEANIREGQFYRFSRPSVEAKTKRLAEVIA